MITGRSEQKIGWETETHAHTHTHTHTRTHTHSVTKSTQTPAASENSRTASQGLLSSRPSLSTILHRKTHKQRNSEGLSLPLGGNGCERFAWQSVLRSIQVAKSNLLRSVHMQRNSKVMEAPALTPEPSNLQVISLGTCLPVFGLPSDGSWEALIVAVPSTTGWAFLQTIDRSRDSTSTKRPEPGLYGNENQKPLPSARSSSSQ
mmetsp:Transcript_17656/g.37811  ORF Transcript_17656/g.37811 Transcript_17656/m.37811 type:complete len:204 (+) Transcript_17656:328-939(+)